MGIGLLRGDATGSVRGCGYGSRQSGWLCILTVDGDGHMTRRTVVHFVMFVIDDTSNSATADEAVAIDAFNDSLRADGQWVLAGGIASPGESVVVDGRGGEVTVTAGPLHDTSDYVSGFWIVSAEDLHGARELAARGSAACRRRVELRPLLGLAR